MHSRPQDLQWYSIPTTAALAHQVLDIGDHQQQHIRTSYVLLDTFHAFQKTVHTLFTRRSFLTRIAQCQDTSRRASCTNCTQDIMHAQTFASDNISQTLPTHLNASSMNMPAANPRLIGTVYQGIIPNQAGSSIARQSRRLKWLSCATHKDQDNQLSHTGSRIPFIYFDVHTLFCMYTLSTLGDFRL